MSLQLIHRWVGVGLCVCVLMIGTTGTLLIWKPELLWLTIPSAREEVDRDIKRMALAAQNIEASYGSDEVRFIQLNSDNLAIHKVFLTEQRYAWHDQSGEQLQVWEGRQRWEDWLLKLHSRFLLGSTVGLHGVGISGLLLIPISLIGLLLWWPRKRSLRHGVRPKAPTDKAWIVAHANLGVWSLVPLFLLAFTGVVLVYPSESRWLLTNWLSDPLPRVETRQSNHVELRWLPAMEYATLRFPDSTLRWLAPPGVSAYGSDGDVLKVGLQQTNEWNRSGPTSIRFKSSALEIHDGLAQSALKRGIDFTYPLHTGKLSLFYRLLLTVFGLMIVMFSAFSLGAFLKRKKSSAIR